MPKTTCALASVLLVLALTAVPVTAKETGSKYDPEVDFSAYKTFRWVDNPHPRGPRVSPGGDLDLLIRAAVTAHLRADGLAEVEEGEADLLVGYDAVAVPVTDIDSRRHELTPGVAWVMEGSMRSYVEGELVVTIRDAGTEQPVWSAWTTEKIKNPGGDPEKRVNKVVKRLMSRYPPKE